MTSPHLSAQDLAANALPPGREQVAASRTNGLLLDEISDPLEAIANLVYLLEAETEDRAKFREYGRLLVQELSRVIEATHKYLPVNFYARPEHDA